MDLEDILKHDKIFRYQLLDRLRVDCEYYLGCGNHFPGHLWAGDEKKQIEYMRLLWNSFRDEEKPDWLTIKQIDEYAEQLKVV